MMLTRRTPENQITLPESALTSVDSAEYFDITVEDGRIILTPVSVQNGDDVRQKLEQLGITERDIDDAVAWARR
jgi:hypothetical protein